jgi:hypothetical protein
MDDARDRDETAERRVRDPAVAGQFYAADPAALGEQIADCFAHEIGPGRLGEADRSGDEAGDSSPRRLRGLVAPHAGYSYSGPVAAHAFAALARSPRPDAVVVLGPNHTGVGERVAVSPADAWRTPLGTVPVATDLASALVSAVPAAEFDERAHAREHAIEVQLPLLQYVADDLSVLPVCMRDQTRETSLAIGDALAELVETSDAELLLLASTDLTHYEPHERATEADRAVLERIEAGDYDGLYDRLERTGHSMCGYGAVAAVLRATPDLAVEVGATPDLAVEIETFAYATSGDTGGSRDSVVGYAAAGVWE